MNPERKLDPEYETFNVWNVPGGLGLKLKLGQFTPHFTEGKQLQLSEDMIEWSTGRRQVCWNSDALQEI